MNDEMCALISWTKILKDWCSVRFVLEPFDESFIMILNSIHLLLKTEQLILLIYFIMNLKMVHIFYHSHHFLNYNYFRYWSRKNINSVTKKKTDGSNRDMIFL